ncbi:MAG TPA: winged helix DNA-binding domain-containing protein [Thermomicrobiales bacterium]|nr:winged helix DNA-binding domain-containing protein [Thermomicrobiales bacterium]
MNATDILTRRLFGQRLAGTPFEKPEDVVEWLGCVQSQDPIGARWSVGQRVANCTDADVAAAFDAGKLLRTHVLRPTWHYVTPENIRWVLQVTAPRVHALSAYMYRQTELDEPLFARAHELFTNALQGGKHLTRAELAAVLAEGGIVAEKMRLAYIVMHAELEGLICSGAVRGKQHTYALLTERAPEAKRLDDDEALAALTRRYFTGHGPATAQDFAWWSSLSLSTIKRGLEMVQHDLIREELDGQTYWCSADAQPSTPQPLTAYLLPEYDEAIWFRSLGFPDMDWTRDSITWNDTFFRPILIGGRRAGVWRRTIASKAIALDAQLVASLTTEERAALNAALERYSTFMGLPVNVSYI